MRSSHSQRQSQRERTDAPPCLFVAAGLFKIVGAKSQGAKLFWLILFSLVFGVAPVIGIIALLYEKSDAGAASEN